jgi:hypothetical protein
LYGEVPIVSGGSEGALAGANVRYMPQLKVEADVDAPQLGICCPTLHGAALDATCDCCNLGRGTPTTVLTSIRAACIMSEACSSCLSSCSAWCRRSAPSPSFLYPFCARASVTLRSRICLSPPSPTNPERISPVLALVAGSSMGWHDGRNNLELPVHYMIRALCVRCVM